MKYTAQYMQTIFEESNFLLFDDKLPQPIFFVFNNSTMELINTFLGWDFAFDGICVPNKNKYFIGVHKDLTPAEFYNTLIHELIHIELMEKYNYSGHGKKFKNKCKKILDELYNI